MTDNTQHIRRRACLTVFRNSNDRQKVGAMKELVPAPHFHYLLHPYSTCLMSCCNAEGTPGSERPRNRRPSSGDRGNPGVVSKSRGTRGGRPTGTGSSTATASHRRQPLHQHEGRGRGTAASGMTGKRPTQTARKWKVVESRVNKA